MNQNDLGQLIFKGNFSKAYLIIASLSNNEIYNLIKKIAWNSQNITIYGFIGYLILKNETHEFHDLASTILSIDWCYFEGTYALALFHARRALELDPDNLEYLQFLIFFYDISEKLIQENEALKIAQHVLKKNPESNLAKETIARITKKNNRF